MHGFKLRDKLTGLYLNKGGEWTKLGKVWTRLSHLKSALRNHQMTKTTRASWEIVVLGEIGSISCDLVLKTQNFREKDVIDAIKNEK